MTEAAESARQDVVDALVNAVERRDALLALLWREYDPSAAFLPGEPSPISLGVPEADQSGPADSTSGLTALETAVMPLDLDEPPEVLARLQNAHELIIQALLLSGVQPDAAGVHGTAEERARAGGDATACRLLDEWASGGTDWMFAENVLATPVREGRLEGWQLEDWLRVNMFDRCTDPIGINTDEEEERLRAETELAQNEHGDEERQERAEASREDVEMAVDQDDSHPSSQRDSVPLHDIKPTLPESASPSTPPPPPPPEPERNHLPSPAPHHSESTSSHRPPSTTPISPDPPNPPPPRDVGPAAARPSPSQAASTPLPPLVPARLQPLIDVLQSLRAQGQIDPLLSRVTDELRYKCTMVDACVLEARQLGFVTTRKSATPSGVDRISLASKMLPPPPSRRDSPPPPPTSSFSTSSSNHSSKPQPPPPLRDRDLSATAYNSQLWVGGIPAGHHSDAELDRLLSKHLLRYLKPNEEVWSMSFHPDRRPGEVFAYVRLDPSFDAKAFDRYVQTNHPLRFEAMPRAKLIFRANNKYFEPRERKNDVEPQPNLLPPPPTSRPDSAPPPPPHPPLATTAPTPASPPISTSSSTNPPNPQPAPRSRDPTHRANASTAQLWIGGITTHQHATIDLERLISDKLRRYLDPSDEIWSMSFYPCTREGNVYAYVRLDPTFDVEAFERAVVAGATRAVVEQQVERPELSSREASWAPERPPSAVPPATTKDSPAPDERRRSVTRSAEPPAISPAPVAPPSTAQHWLADEDSPPPSPRAPPSPALPTPKSTLRSAALSATSDLTSLRSTIPPATFWDPLAVPPTPSFTRTLPLSTTFGHISPSLASRALSQSNTVYTTDPERQARFVSFLEGQRDATRTEHYDKRLERVRGFGERNMEFGRLAEEIRREKEMRGEGMAEGEGVAEEVKEEQPSRWKRVRGEEGNANKWGPD